MSWPLWGTWLVKLEVSQSLVQGDATNIIFLSWAGHFHLEVRFIKLVYSVVVLPSRSKCRAIPRGYAAAAGRRKIGMSSPFWTIPGRWVRWRLAAVAAVAGKRLVVDSVRDPLAFLLRRALAALRRDSAENCGVRAGCNSCWCFSSRRCRKLWRFRSCSSSTWEWLWCVSATDHEHRGGDSGLCVQFRDKVVDVPVAMQVPEIMQRQVQGRFAVYGGHGGGWAFRWYWCFFFFGLCPVGRGVLAFKRFFGSPRLTAVSHRGLALHN